MFLRGEFFRVTDCFTLLGVPRRPRLDAAELKAAHLRLSAAAHPDAEGGEAGRFREIQEAYQILLNPASRLRHLLELQFGPLEKMPPSGHPELFLQVGAALQQARVVQQRREKSQSVLSRALLAQDEAAARRGVEEAGRAVDRALDQAERQEVALDAAWPVDDPRELVRLVADRVYLARWKSELAEWTFRLAQSPT